MKDLRQLVKMLFMVGIVITMTLALTVAAKAAPSKVTGVKQTDYSQSSIDLQWDALLDNGVRYEVSVSTDKKNWVVKIEREYDNTGYVYNLNAGSTYYVRVRAYVEESSVKQYGDYSNIVECVTSPNSKPSSLKKTDSTTTSITLNWSKVPGANCYEVSYKKSDAPYGTQPKKKIVTSTKITLTKLSKNAEYDVYVYPARRVGSKGYMAVSESNYVYMYRVGVTPAQVKGVSVPYYFFSSKEIKVECNKIEIADGYQFEAWTAYKGKDTKVASVVNSSYYGYLKSAAFGKNNFFKVKARAYTVTSDGKKKYGQWSSWKYVCPQPKIVKISSTSKGLKYTWENIQGADRYDLYVSLQQQSGYKKVASVKKGSYLLAKYNNKPLKKGRTYYAYVVPYNKVGKKLYSGMSGDANKCWYIKYNK